jgi:thiol-disulfide isomerase/thioredoxin
MIKLLLLILIFTQSISYAGSSMSDLFNKYPNMSVENQSDIQNTSGNREVIPAIDADTKSNVSDKPIFKLLDIKGNTFTDKNTDGKYLVINFWATWCKPCLQEIPILVGFYNKHSDKVLVLGMSYEKSNRIDVEGFTSRLNVNYPIILFSEVNAPYFSKFTEIKGMPTTVIYNPKGKLVGAYLGQVNKDILTREAL